MTPEEIDRLARFLYEESDRIWDTQGIRGIPWEASRDHREWRQLAERAMRWMVEQAEPAP